MARPLRIEFPGTIYHVMSGATPGRRSSATKATTRGFATDWRSLSPGGWDVLSFVLMPNHFHLLVRTPQPNLSGGMQYLTSGYANWCPGGISVRGTRFRAGSRAH